METKNLICKFCGQDHALPLKKFCDRSDLEIKYDQLQKRVAELETNRIHTCHDQCPKIECVQRRRIEELEAENKKLREALSCYAELFRDDIKSVENTLALMSEGEGNNPETYQTMAKDALDKLRRVKALGEVKK